VTPLRPTKGSGEWELIEDEDIKEGSESATRRMRKTAARIHRLTSRTPKSNAAMTDPSEDHEETESENDGMNDGATGTKNQ
jgi:hypothetical protein